MASGHGVVNRTRRLVLPVIACVAMAGLSDCQRSGGGPQETDASATAAPSGADAVSADAASKDAASNPEVQLKPEQALHLGIVLEAAQAGSAVPEVQGYGLVLTHDVVAQAVAELATAAAAERQSRAALERAGRLAGTDGALSADALEGAQRQAAVDAAALALAHRRLSATLGLAAPWSAGGHDAQLDALAGGQLKLVRATFPLGSWKGGPPPYLRIAHLDPDPLAESWKLTRPWNAPADANVPGRSFFALLEATQFSEGERVQVWAPSGAAVSGVLVPAAALVVSGGSYWCYVQKEAGTFVRVPVDTGLPAEGGYLVTRGIAAGERIVTSAAGLLLARELNPSTEAE
jgi:hypothetical protein